jgi:hypothetical protein
MKHIRQHVAQRKVVWANMKKNLSAERERGWREG